MVGLPFTLRQLDVFERLCEVQSFRKASEDLGISQASVSNQLKALEEQLGVLLLSRDAGKRPQLTSDGAAFLADLGKFKAAAEALASHRRASPRGVDVQPVELNVLIGSYLFKDYIRPKLDRFFQAHPNIMLNVDAPVLLDGHRHSVARGNYDLAIFQDVVTAPLHPGLRELGRVRCGLFGHRKFLAGRNEFLTAEEVGDLPLLLPPAGTYLEQVILGMLAKYGVKPKTISGRTAYFDVMVEMIERGETVAPSIDSLIMQDGRRNTVLLFRLDDFRLNLFRNPNVTGSEIDLAEAFLVSAVLNDPPYPLAKTVSTAT